MILHGWLCLDKPLNMSSAQAVGRVKRILDLPKKYKIGHAGTLDPLASGILPLALGEATKTVQYVMAEQKAYIFTIMWGKQTSTDDAEGEVVATSEVIPSQEDIHAVLPQFMGKIQQMPPAYSAIKVNGKRAYALARAGEHVKLKAREVEVYNLRYLRYSQAHDSANRESLYNSSVDSQLFVNTKPENDDITASFNIECSKGTYIRSLARDIAHALGTVGHISMLRRTKCGKFHEDNAISLDFLDNMVHKGATQEKVSSYLVDIESVLDDIPAFSVQQADASALRHGKHITAPSEDITHEVALILSEGSAVALASVNAGIIRPVRVFNLV